MGEVKVTTKTRRAPGARREAKKGPDSARIAVVGIPASGKTRCTSVSWRVTSA